MAAHENVNPQQLRMFMPVREVIDTVHKGDHGDPGGRTPRQQWEEPLPEDDDDDYGGLSLRDVKLGEHFGNDRIGRAQREMHDAYNTKRIERGDAKPISIAYVPIGWDATGEVQELIDGHHRLAYHEKMGRSEIPVQWDDWTRPPR